VNDELLDVRKAAVPAERTRCGSAAAVTVAAPITLVSKVARQVAASTSASRASVPVPVA
jgi:hypothetical protein